MFPPSIVDSGDGMFLDNAIAANGGSTYVSKDYQANLAEAKKASQRQAIPTVRASRPSLIRPMMSVTTRLLQSISSRSTRRSSASR